MCIDCGCYGTVTPYGVGGRTPTELPKAPDVSKYNKPIVRIGETPMMKMEDYNNSEDND